MVYVTVISDVDVHVVENKCYMHIPTGMKNACYTLATASSGCNHKSRKACAYHLAIVLIKLIYTFMQ